MDLNKLFGKRRGKALTRLGFKVEKHGQGPVKKYVYASDRLNYRGFVYSSTTNGISTTILNNICIDLEKMGHLNVFSEYFSTIYPDRFSKKDRDKKEFI